MRLPVIILAVALLSACGSPDALPPSETYGPQPKLPPPGGGLLPTLNPAKAVGWPPGEIPDAPNGMIVQRFADGLDHPRWLYRLPNGDVLVAESNAPPKEVRGITAWIAKKVMERAGAGVPSANRITLLRDADGDGVAELKTPFLTGLNSPIGMALVGDQLFVANTDTLLAFPYQAGATRITAPGRKITDLPHSSASTGHWVRNVVASPDGRKLYVSVGSNSNIGDNGMETEVGRAAIWQMNLDGSEKRIFASGLRNANGMAFEPATGALWATVNERDMLGPDLVPDYMTAVREGGFYGWPYSYWGQNVDERVKPQRPDLVATAITPDYALGAHTASLGLHFYQGPALPERYRGGAFIGQHGSWNRKPPSGYKVVFVPFSGGRPAGPAEDFLTGFLSADETAYGRPVGVIEDRTGALLVADDVGNVVWRVAQSSRTPQ